MTKNKKSKQFNFKKNLIILSILLVFIVLITVYFFNNGNDELFCNSFSIDSCPDECVVCPPCSACSSISCQTKDFCKSIGINKSWYDSIKSGLNDSSTRSTVQVTEKEIHCLSWMDSELGRLQRESTIINMSSYSLITNKTICTDFNLTNGIVSKGMAFGSCGYVQNPWDSFINNCGSFEFYLTLNGSLKDICLILNDEIVFSEIKDGKTDRVIGKGSCE